MRVIRIGERLESTPYQSHKLVEQELPTEEEMDEGRKNLAGYGNKVHPTYNWMQWTGGGHARHLYDKALI